MIRILTTLTLITTSFFCLSQGFTRKNQLTINHTNTTILNGEDTVKCLRLSQAEWKKLSEIDQDIRTWGQHVESYLQQKKSGLTNVDDNNFIKSINSLERLVSQYKIPLKTSFYRDEFSFYKKHPVKTQAQIKEEAIAKFHKDQEVERLKESQEAIKRQEYNRKIGLRNDSIKAANERSKVINDSISEVNYQIEITKEKEQQKRHAQKLKKEQEEKELQQKIRKENIIKKYGNETGGLIIDKKVKIGWTKQMCIESWGKPKEVNTTTTANLIHEQWVYSLKRYLYFENNILTAIQD